MKRSIAPFWTEAALILLIVGVAVVSVVAYQRSDRTAPLSAGEKEKLSLTRKADALERENRTLRETVRALEVRIAQREDATGVRTGLLTDIKELRKRRDVAQASAKTAEAIADKTRKALATLEEKVRRETARLEAFRATAAEKESALVKARDSLHIELKSLAKRKTEATRKAGAAAADLIRIEQTLGERRAELVALSEKIAITNKALAALDDRIDQRNTDLETTRDAVSRNQAEAAKTRDTLRKELESLTQQEAAAAKRTETVRADLTRMTQALSALEITLRERRADLAKVSEQTARQKTASRQATQALTSEIEALKIQRDLAERQVDAGKSQAARLRHEVDALQTKLRARQAKLKSVEDAVRRRKSSLEAIPAPPAAQTPEQLTDRNVCLEAWARVAAEPNARARLAKLREKIAAAETELCELNKRHKAAKEKLKPSATEPVRPRP